MQGVLLAAGFGRRFQSGDVTQQDKLMAHLPNDDKPILWHSANALITALPNSIAVIQPHQTARQKVLQALGFLVVPSVRAEQGMGFAIADAVAASQHAHGWLITLADMPWVTTALINTIIAHATTSTSIVAPRFKDKRGQPVAFGANWGDQLMRLNGDIGARDILKTATIDWVDWHDDSIHADVDTIDDMTN
jgi:molybdenum cofactor cytidylyltransferase